MRKLLIVALVWACGTSWVQPSQAVVVDITGGQTSVLLDASVLTSVGLALSGVSAPVMVPGNLGEGSVAFNINARDAMPPLRATTFSYDSDDFLGTFSGTLEHEGSVFFNDNTIEVGNFSIGFDAARVGGSASGFFVESTVGLEAILFDVAAPSQLVASASELTIGADLLVSPELATVLGDASLAGADVGDALVQGVPEPGALGMLLCGLAFLGRLGRR